MLNWLYSISDLCRLYIHKPEPRNSHRFQCLYRGLLHCKAAMAGPIRAINKFSSRMHRCCHQQITHLVGGGCCCCCIGIASPNGSGNNEEAWCFVLNSFFDLFERRNFVKHFRPFSAHLQPHSGEQPSSNPLPYLFE